MNKYFDFIYIIIGFIIARIIFKNIGNNSLIVEIPPDKMLDNDINCIGCCQTCL